MSTFEQQQKHIQSWHEPALRTLSGLLKKRKENLARQNRDVNNAAVTRDEFMQALVDQHGKHGLYLVHAGQIISSLYQAKRIRYLGSTFIQMNEEESK
ncbi:hypothetical protein [Acinetobacter baumannii]|uniref:hypothetical protein n=1 Tax=Acinetobacter baumannii TaxID=470 RepID=UPI0010226E32|nr:hypothetical protein [Acinetobacter baumannii]RYL13276.1 hypothetical protein EWO92_20075 [Acinetobacter baumannii]RYL25478.1 hypothetical protein EWO96_20030 [Acinetobacter baumannii]RYL41465.1 hypothetical protein EWP49_20005 [Acinetobacter baumannii]